MRSRHLLAVTALAALAAAPAAGAWEPPDLASKGPLAAHSPDVAVNARGDAVAAWVRGTRRAAMIVTSRRRAGGGWEEPVAISRRGRPAIDPQVAIDAGGRALVTWRQVVRTRIVRSERGRRRQAVYVARARERGDGDARWSPITTLSSSVHKVGPPRLAMDDAGTAVVAWHWGTGTTPRAPGFVGRVQVTERDAGGTWSTARRVSFSRVCRAVRLPRVAVGGGGHAVVWWQCDGRGGRNTAHAVSREPGGAFGPESELPFRTRAAVSADLALSDTGRAAAVSADADGSLRWWSGQAGERIGVATLPSLATAERSDTGAGAPRIAVNATGDALTAWTDRLGRPRTAPLASKLGVGTPTSLGPADDGTRGVRVAVADRTRSGAVAWIADGRVVAAARAADGTLRAGEPVSGPGVRADDPPALDMDAGGDAVLLWTREAGGRTVVERTTGPGL